MGRHPRLRGRRAGFVARSDERQVTAADGRWTSTPTPSSTAAPETCEPSLWRQGQLLTRDGLFEVVPGIYQLRGFDLLVMSVIEGDEGVVVIDPLISKETAAAASLTTAGARETGPSGR